MVNDWIKMRTDLYRDPKVSIIADSLISESGELSCYVSQHFQRDMTVTRNVMRNAVVGALVAVWGVARHRGKRRGDDILMPGCFVSVVDDIADIVGFGSAMASVGWIVEDESGVTFPRFFEEFNADPLDNAKAKNAQRQARYRGKLSQESNVTGDVTGDVTVTSQSNAREEKRREENKDPPSPPQPGGTPPATTDGPAKLKPSRKPPEPIPIPPELDAPEFVSVWTVWRAARKPSARAAVLQLKSLVPLGPKAAAECVESSLRNDWQGIFPQKHTASPHGKSGGYQTRREKDQQYLEDQFENFLNPEVTP